MQAVLQEVPSLPGRSDRTCGLALPPFPAQPASGEGMLLERGIVVLYETIRRWAAKFGPAIARGVRRRAPRPGEIGPLDELRVIIRGVVHCCGVPSTSMASYSTRSFSGVAMLELQRRCSPSC